MPGSYGMYSTEQLPSLLSVHDIFASEGPSTARPNPPVPAPLQMEKVSMDHALIIPYSPSIPVCITDKE